MNRTRQNTLQDRLSAMTRVLSGVAAAALVFSIVFFSPLIDMKDTTSAAAQSRAERGGGRSERGDRSERRDRQDRDDRGRGDRDRGDRDNDRDDRDRRDRDRDDRDRNDRDQDDRDQDDRDNDQSNASRDNRDNDEDQAETSSSPQTETRSSKGTSSISDASAQEKPRSGGFLKRIFGGGRFVGDSEPSGEPLSRGQEQEAIQNGWK